MAGGKRKAAKRDEAGAEPATFDIKAKLPEAIDEAAFRSGDYPYDRKMKGKRYDKELEPLQIELLKLQSWVKDTGQRVVIVFEGRDGAARAGDPPLHAASQPARARVVALSKPSDIEKGQWYFQRYAALRCPRRAKSCSSTAPGTTAPAWSP